MMAKKTDKLEEIDQFEASQSHDAEDGGKMDLKRRIFTDLQKMSFLVALLLVLTPGKKLKME